MAANLISGPNGAASTIGSDDITSLSSKSSASSSSSGEDAGVDEQNILLMTTNSDFESVAGGRASYSNSSVTTLQVRAQILYCVVNNLLRITFASNMLCDKCSWPDFVLLTNCETFDRLLIFFCLVELCFGE